MKNSYFQSFVMSQCAFALFIFINIEAYATNDPPPNCEKLRVYLQVIFGEDAQDLIDAYLQKQSPETLARLYLDVDEYLRQKIESSDVRERLPETRENEIFQIFPGIRLDIELAAKLIMQRTIPYKIVKLNVVDHVERIYHFSKRTLPPKKEWSLYKNINIEHLITLSPDRLEIPGIAIQLDSGQLIIIDGNHRCARLYFDGQYEFTVYAIPASEINRLRSSH